jgi:streptogramin lyase
VEFQLRHNADPHDISVDAQGIAWISEHSGTERGPEGAKPGVGMVSRIDPKTLSYTQMAPPAGKFPSRPSGSAVDPQGVVWHDDNGHNARLIAYNPKTQEFKTYAVPAPPRLKDTNDGGGGNGSANMNTITFQDGFVWGSGLLSSQIYRLDPASGEVITYPFPKGTPPYGLAFDKNKMLWTSLEFADEIVKMDPATGKKTHYKIPSRHGDVRHIQTDADGNVWAAAQQSDKLIRVDGRTGQVTEYEPPTKLSGVDTVDVDRKHNLIWIGEDQTDKLARFDPRTHTFTEFPLPTAGAGVKRIAIDPSNPNRVWWCSTGGTSRAGYIEVLE